MAINYSLCKIKNLFTQKYKVYARAQYSEVVSFEDFASHISSHNSVFDRATVAGVLTTAVDCLREMLLAGRKVQLGDLGAFAPKLRCEGSDTADGWTQDKIKSVQVLWTRGKCFDDMLSEATFNYVGTRATQASGKAEEKATLDEEITAQD